jgi:hypothetical protein
MHEQNNEQKVILILKERYQEEVGWKDLPFPDYLNSILGTPNSI